MIISFLDNAFVWSFYPGAAAAFARLIISQISGRSFCMVLDTFRDLY